MSSPSLESADSGDMDAKITAQGDKVRELKGKKADKADIDAAVKMLLDLKVKILKKSTRHYFLEELELTYRLNLNFYIRLYTGLAKYYKKFPHPPEFYIII